MLVERAIGKFAKVTLYRARERLFAEYVVIVTLGSRTSATKRCDFCGISLYHHPAHLLRLHSRSPSYRFFSTWTFWLLGRGRRIGSLFVLSHNFLLFTPVAIYLNTIVCSIRIAHSALFSLWIVFVTFRCFCIAVRARPRKLLPQSSFTTNQRRIFPKIDTLLYTRLKYPFLVGRLVLLLCSIHSQPCLNAFVW